MLRTGLAGDFWERELTGAMLGDPACAAHVLAKWESER